MLRGAVFAAVCVIASLNGAVVASSQAKTSFVATHGDWGVYKNTTLGSLPCYVVSAPVSSSPANVKHGDNFAVIAMSGSHAAPQLVMGYPLKQSALVDVFIDGKRHAFFAEGNRAWADDAGAEATFVERMKAGSRMSVKAQSQRGTKTEYQYSLKGLTRAMQQMNACNGR